MEVSYFYFIIFENLFQIPHQKGKMSLIGDLGTGEFLNYEKIL